MKITKKAKELAEKTRDAYSYCIYGRDEWQKCSQMLLSRGYSSMQAEAILRSKWTRWSMDQSVRGRDFHMDLAEFLDAMNAGDRASRVAKLVESTF